MAEPVATSPPAPRRRLAVSTALFAVATGLSRVAGVIREIIAGWAFGVQGAGINAFTVAFQIPNLVRALVADAALGAAFVPVFNELLQRGERERAWRVASSVIWIAFAGLSLVTAVFMVFAPEVMGLFGYEGELGVALARLMFPIVVLLGLNGIVIAILNAFEEFFVPAIAPVAWNAVIIGVLAAAVPFVETVDGRLYAYAIGILLGTLVQFLLPLPWLRGRGGHIGLHVDLRDEAVGRVFRLMFPVTLGLGLINFSLTASMWFAARVAEDLGPAALDKAFRVYMLPQGIFSVAVAAVLFPALSRLAAAGEVDRFRTTLVGGLRQIAFLLVPAAVACAVLAEPIVRLLYERGQFDPAETTVVAEVLAAFSLGLAFNGAMLLLNRAFFSLQTAWAPTWIALGTLVLNLLFAAALYEPFGIWGIALAVSLTNIVGVAALLVRLRGRLGGLDGRRTAAALVRIGVAAALLGGVAYAVWWPLDDALGRSLPAQVLSLGAALAAGGGAYLAAARAFGLEELRLLASLRRRGR